MARRRRAERREVVPDPKFKSPVVAKFICNMMRCGKKSVAERIFYDALSIVHNKLSRDPLDVFMDAVELVMPSVEVRSRRVGGATYQVPIEVRSERRMALSIRWIISAARSRHEPTMTARLAAEVTDAFNKRGGAFKKKEEVHRMAEANRAFSHYRW